MKALTIWQPWATLIAIGAKRYEFRGWDYRTRVPGLVGERIAIHAGTRTVRRAEVTELMQRLRREGDRGTALDVVPTLQLLDRVLIAPGLLPLASVVATAVLEKPRKPLEIFKGDVLDSDRADHSIWAWPLADVHRLPEPVPARGFQGFWEWADA